MKILSLTICNYKNYCGEQKVDFTIDDPQKNITLVGGQNGAGKTTLVKLLKGLLKPVNGTVFLKDTNIAEKTVATLAGQVG